MNLKQELENLVAKCRQEGSQEDIYIAIRLLKHYDHLSEMFERQRNPPALKSFGLPEGKYILTFRGQIDNPKPDPEDPFYVPFNL